MVIRTRQGGEYEASTLIACSGLMADRLVKMLGVDPGFIICPFRGEYFQLAPQHNQIVNHLIYPIPDPAMPFLGVHLTRMIDGSVTVGPNAVLALKREGYRKRDISLADTLEILTSPGIRRVLQNNLRSGLGEMKNSLCRSGYLRLVQKYCPSLTLSDLRPWPAGVRAQAPAPEPLRLVVPCIVAGIGCRRGACAEAIEEAFLLACGQAGISPSAVREAATIDVKAHEEGLLAFCRARNIPLATYSAEELSQVEGSVSPSDFVRATVGVDNVCERAALADGGKLIFPKLAHGGVTVAFSKVTIELSFKER